MANMNVEDEIKKHYLADDGMWLVEKGKIKEAKLLKEAHERIIWLKSQYNHYSNAHQKGYESVRQQYQSDLDTLRDELEKQKRLNRDLARKMESIKLAVTEFVLLEGKI